MLLTISNIYLVMLIYFLIISFYSIMLTCSDKHLAKKGGRRVPEKSCSERHFLGEP